MKCIKKKHEKIAILSKQEQKQSIIIKVKVYPFKLKWGAQQHLSSTLCAQKYSMKLKSIQLRLVRKRVYNSIHRFSFH